MMMMQLDGKKKLKSGKRLIAGVLMAACVFSMAPAQQVHADLPRTRVLTMKQCRDLAIANSMEYANCEDAISSKQAAYESAVKAIKLKQINMSTFRWSPLLSFKFPTKPNFSEASEFNYKPVEISYEIKTAEHKLQDKTFEIAEKVNNLYVEIVVLQSTIAFNERRLQAANEGLARNEAKLRLGQANQGDVDKLKKKVEATTNKIASSRRSLEADLKKLTTMLGIDVTTGYSFEKPYVEATISRDNLEGLIQYTEDRDEGYFEACIAATSARAELQTNSGLVRNKYGGDYNMIATYVNTSLNGGAINSRAFKKSYKAFLEKIDSYWNGKKRIIFFKIPRLWFKGSLDGTRYIEDDPYVLYQNCLDYVAAANEQKAAKQELDQSVEDTFNNYISVRNSYKQYIKDVADAENNLNKDMLRNKNGELSFEEYDSEMDSYEELQNSMLDAMKLYTTTLYSFDRLTCGGVSALLSGTDADMQTAVVGESYPQKNTADGARYTMRGIVQNQEFELGIYIPDDFKVTITDFELWVDNIQVGQRTTKDKKLRHLMLTTEAVTEVKIRLYNGDEFVDDCIIDPGEETGPLKITSGYEIKKNEGEKIGTFVINTDEGTGLIEIQFTMDKPEIKSFKILTQDDKAVGGDFKIDITKPLKYISIFRQSLGELKIEFYDEGGAVLEKGRFDEANGQVLREDE
ncbi:MAG: hypothetical protein K6E91_02405 [Butyrivibrio sp.]|nr:hypothetical protein [Butyrivibrio sp.]